MAKPVEPRRDIDGLDQSWLTEILWLWRFRQCRRRAVRWRLNNEMFERAAMALPRLRDFGNETYGTAEVSGQIWIVRERYFHGWPDPPRFFFFAMSDGSIWSAADFADWPVTWCRETGRDGTPEAHL
ncbi:MAG: hypothetical protein JJ938_09025 [Roseicyclus sp.]|nr:hypothetical protein [Roseicyclus sp.]MBO6625009.1 hypothetical protein [Roseicyclus sp.]MBO6923297.1 hypothetical protein [Roseicyclus sp.]